VGRSGGRLSNGRESPTASCAGVPSFPPLPPQKRLQLILATTNSIQVSAKILDKRCGKRREQVQMMTNRPKGLLNDSKIIPTGVYSRPSVTIAMTQTDRQ